MLHLMHSTKKTRLKKEQHHVSNKLNDPQIHKLKFNGRNLNFYIRSFSGDFDVFYEVFWRKNYSLKKTKLQHFQTIMDIGANVGYTSVFYHLDYPKANIYSVEPSKSSYVILKKNTAEFKNIHCINAAVYTKNTELDFVESDLAYNSKINVSEGSNYKVKAYTISKLMEMCQLKEIDLLKIDIEGIENILFTENNQWLAKVNHLIVELHHPYNLQALLADVSPFGFQLNTAFPEKKHLFFLSKI